MTQIKLFDSQGNPTQDEPDDTQCGMILRYLKDCGAITPVDAMREFGCFRLGARVHDLKRRGYNIVNEWEESINRYGKTVRYAKYRLVTT